MAAGVRVSKEYVREQLHSMGVRDLSEEDLEAYTNDFARLIQKHLQEETPVSDASSEESLRSSLPSGESLSSTTDQTLFQEDNFRQHTAAAEPHLSHRKSAIFKTFPGDKENRMYPLPMSPSPSPRKAPHTSIAHLSNVHQGHTPLEMGSRGSIQGEKPIIIARKRKVLRMVNGETRVFDESYSSVEDSPSVGSVASGLAELSLTSLTSSTDSTSTDESTPSTSESSHSRGHCRQQYKSFIRPAMAQLYTRRLKKHDPVSRYHYWKEVWEKEKFPGMENRSALRWQIREQMMQQDLPLFVPPRRPVKVNNYTVPTDKKRAALRWEIRHQMAEQ